MAACHFHDGGILMNTSEVLRMEDITKVYPNGVLANNKVNFTALEGEIHALSGENGAGKSTLMKILFGEEQPTSGNIYLNGEKVVLSNSNIAISRGIGMVHQHFMLVPSLTVMENMILGQEPRKGIVIDTTSAEKQVRDISEKYDLQVDLHARIMDLSVGQKQKVEILKALLHGAKILILDEPTAVLTPQETKLLFKQLRALARDRYTIIFISHKLNEIKELCDRITIIRKGMTKGTFLVKDVDEEEISQLMVGRSVSEKPFKPACHPGEKILEVENLVVRNKIGKTCVDGISFATRRGEIFGIAGVEGNGQTELVEVISGLNGNYKGSIRLKGKDLKGMDIPALRKEKVSYIPEDRMTVGMAGELSVLENALADKIDLPRFSKYGLIRRKETARYGKEIIDRFQILCKSPDVEIKSLSGGNIQKVVLARELSEGPDFIIADQPTRGVDVGASEFIRNELIDLRNNGKSVFLISSDLHELLSLSDRVIVLCNGRISAYFKDVESITEEDLGRYMLGVARQDDDIIEEVAR